MSGDGCLHWSALSRMRQSPLHFRHYQERGLTATPAMRFGTLVYAMVFRTMDNMRVYNGYRRGNKWTEFKDANPDVEIYTGVEWERAEAVAESALAVAGELLTQGQIEQRIEWVRNGIPCAGTPDVHQRGVLVDLKVTNDASPRAMQFQTTRMGWHGQQAWYAEGIRLACGLAPQRNVIVAVEPKPPHPCVVYDLGVGLMEQARILTSTLFDRYCFCKENDFWPGYTDSGTSVLESTDDTFVLNIDGEDVTV